MRRLIGALAKDPNMVMRRQGQPSRPMPRQPQMQSSPQMQRQMPLQQNTYQQPIDPRAEFEKMQSMPMPQQPSYIGSMRSPQFQAQPIEQPDRFANMQTMPMPMSQQPDRFANMQTMPGGPAMRPQFGAPMYRKIGA